MARIAFEDAMTAPVIDIPVMAQRQIHMNRKVHETMEVPQLQSPD